MIKITIADHFVSEKKYVIDILFNEFLGLDYHILMSPRCKGYCIQLENKNKIVVEDHFFNRFEDYRDYLNAKHIPVNVGYSKNRFAVGGIPVIFGTGRLEEKKGKISCGIDIFASVFFMLSRWEEYANPVRDTHQRFPATASLAFKQNFLDRPVVNEYVEMLWQMLCDSGCKQQKKEHPFSFVLTHDVDALLKWLGWYGVLRTAAGDILKRRQPGTAISRVQEYTKIRRGKIKDPFDTYDWLMDLSESLNLKSRFYFMSSGISRSPFDNRTPYPIDHPAARAIFTKIKKRGHIIGFHPGYDSGDDEILWETQKKQLEKVCACPVTSGRQHFLRFSVPHTWQLWENQGMEVDSTCGFADREGFRCGTGNLFSVFNILTRQKLKLKEMPLVFMDARNFVCGGFQANSQFEHNLGDIIHNAKKFKSLVTLLFHNTVFIDNAYVQMYREILEKG